jgi:sirohydrochlorin cobaltochelatase
MRLFLTRRFLTAAFLGVALMNAPPVLAQTGDFGVLVMAHGGSPQWNADVETMLAPVARDYPLEIAFGMADAASLQDAVTRLEARGVSRIAVVRLFISGESWFERTNQILGVEPGAPTRPALDSHAGHGAAAGGHGGHGMEFWRLSTNASFAVSREGLMDAREMGDVLVERARALSQSPANESVLIIAHGPETDEENARWLQLIGQRAASVTGYRDVHVETLREDWPEKRADSEARIRSYVERNSAGDGRVLVVPYRVSGFGPYARVLEGLDYASDGRGLIPSVEVEHWVRRQAEEMRAGQFLAPQRVADAHRDHPGGH